MPVIEIECPAEFNGVKSSTGYGTRIIVDGHELPEVKSIRVDIGLEHPVTATVEMLASKAFTFKADDARLIINVVALEGWRIVAKSDGGTVIYTAEQIP